MSCVEETKDSGNSEATDYLLKYNLTGKNVNDLLGIHGGILPAMPVFVSGLDLADRRE
jgi:hypothetical protein